VRSLPRTYLRLFPCPANEYARTMRTLTGLLVLAAALAPTFARADGEIVIDLKPPPAVKADPPAGDTSPEMPGVPRQHVAVARRMGGVPLPLPAAPKERSYGQLGMTLAADNPIFRKADARSGVVSRPGARQYVIIRKPFDHWYAVLMADGSTGYIPSNYVKLLNYRVTDAEFGPAASLTFPRPPATASKLARTILEAAFGLIGTSYVWGGNDERGIDCSGLVKYCFGAAGIALPRTATQQAALGASVDFSDLQPGDRLYFAVKYAYDHTGIYIGDGYFIHSSKSRSGVAVSQLSEPLFARSLAAARR
jgi:cell wall-associated NlpC family hydrolase